MQLFNPNFTPLQTFNSLEANARAGEIGKRKRRAICTSQSMLLIVFLDWRTRLHAPVYYLVCPAVRNAHKPNPDVPGPILLRSGGGSPGESVSSNFITFPA